MGAVYDEDDELDFTFLRQSARQQPRGAAAGRRIDDSERDQMANLISERRQGRTNQGRSGQGQAVRRRQVQSRSGQGQAVRERQMQGRSGQDQAVRERQMQAAQNRSRQGQAARNRSGQAQASRAMGSIQSRQGQPAQSRSRQGRAAAKRPQTMQERQAALLARKRRRLRRQKQLLAILLCILLAGSASAILWIQQAKPESGVETETGSQTMAQVQAEGTGEDYVWGTVQGIPESQYNQHPDWTEDFLTISEYSRPGEPLEEVKNIFVHYTANPNTSAAQNRNYFENLKDNHDVPGASSHFIIGINGEILQIVPLDEIAYAVQTRNEDSISIECCFKNQNGQFTQETYDSLIELLAWLVSTYELEPDDILRHYDCGGKKCPLYYVDHEDAWRILKQDVAKRIALMQ